MNTMCIFFVVYLAHSSVIQALQCYNGSKIVSIPWNIPTERERQEFYVYQRARMVKDFPLIECGSEFSQCFKIVPDCGIQDAYLLVKGCALPEGNSTCVLRVAAIKYCQDWEMVAGRTQKNRECKMCSNGNGCNKEEWQNAIDGDNTGSSSTLPASTTTGTIDIFFSTTDQNGIVDVTTNGMLSCPIFF